MFALITCPTCNHQFSVPEAAMGKRCICHNCQAPFVAGKSVAVAVNPQAPSESSFNKTMLANGDSPIQYNCPRCKAP